MSVQQKIDNALSDAGRHNRAILIVDDSGSANVPEDVTVNFRNCTISSLQTSGNNRINVEGGTIASFDLKDTALLVRGATISGDGKADGSKVEITGSTVSGKVTLTTSSSLVSRKNTYSGSEAFDVSDGSKVRSVSDTFSCSTLVKGDGRGSEIVVVTGTINVSTLVNLTGGCSASFDGGTFQCSDCGTVDNASVELRNIQNVQVTKLFQLSNGGRALVKKIQTLTANTGFVGTSKSAVEVVDVQTATIQQNFVALNDSRAEVTRFQTITCTSTLVKCFNGSQARVGNGKTLTVNGTLASLDSSKLTLDAIETINVNGSGCSVANGSSFAMKDCTTVTASGSLATGSDSGTIHFSGCTTVKADTLISTNGDFDVALLSNDTLHGSTVVATMTSDGSATLEAKDCSTLKSDGDSVFDVTGVNCTFTDLPDVENSGSRYTIKGRDGGTQRQQMQFSKVVIQQGGFDCQHYHLQMYATTFQKFNTDNCDIEFSRSTQQNSQADDDSRFDRSWVKARFTNWDAAIHGTQGVFEFAHSNCSDDFKTADSVLRLSVMRSSVGLQSDSSTSRGNVATFEGYDVGTLTAASNKKDSFLLANVGSPSYSGQGAALVLQTTPPGQSLLDFLYVTADDVRMYDSRNSYVDVQSDVYTKSAQGNITEDAAIAYDVSAGTAINLQAPSIVESSS